MSVWHKRPVVATKTQQALDEKIDKFKVGNGDKLAAIQWILMGTRLQDADVKLAHPYLYDALTAKSNGAQITASSSYGDTLLQMERIHRGS